MRLIKIMILIGAVFSIAGMAFVQLLLLVVNPRDTSSALHLNDPRQDGFKPT